MGNSFKYSEMNLFENPIQNPLNQTTMQFYNRSLIMHKWLIIKFCSIEQISVTSDISNQSILTTNGRGQK